MKTQLLGRSPLRTTRLAYGCWRLVGTMDPREVTPDREAAGRAAVRAALDAGYTSFDHADIYCAGVCERVFGDAVKDVPGWRDRCLVATKCGIVLPGPGVQHRYDSSPAHIVRSCEASLRRLGVEMIDLYQLHRPDLLMDPAAVAGAFDQLRAQGKVREFGVSNFPPATVAALQKALPFPLAVNQVEVHLGRLDCLYDGTLDQCLAERMTPLAWSPLGGGALGDDAAAGGGTSAEGRGKPADARAALLANLRVEVDAVAAEHGVTRSVVALAWLLAHPAGIVPIVGSASPQRIKDAVKADAVELTREQWYRLLIAARGTPIP
jgi:predicted oxidoreductase